MKTAGLRREQRMYSIRFAHLPKTSDKTNTRQKQIGRAVSDAPDLPAEALA